MPASRASANHRGSACVRAKHRVVSTGTSAESQKVPRRPSRWVMAEAKGVIRNTPIQPVAANTPASAVGAPRVFRRSSSSGASMK